MAKDYAQKQREKALGLEGAKTKLGAKAANSWLDAEKVPKTHTMRDYVRETEEAHSAMRERAAVEEAMKRTWADPFASGSYGHLNLQIVRESADARDPFGRIRMTFSDPASGHSVSFTVAECFSPTEFEHIRHEAYQAAKNEINYRTGKDAVRRGGPEGQVEPVEPEKVQHKKGHFPTHWIAEAIDLAEQSDMAITFGIEREGIMVMAMSEGEQYAIRVTGWTEMEHCIINPLLPAIEDVERKLSLLIKMKEVA
jgi:hypothetical protein